MEKETKATKSLSTEAQPEKSALSKPVGNGLGYFNADQLEQALRIADKFHKAGCFGVDVKNPEQAFVKIQAGAEMGMPPMEAMNSLYIVNGKVTIYGQALSKKLKEHGWNIEYQDCDSEKATVVITKNGKTHEETATKEDLLKLNSRAVKFAPKDKLKWHALSRLVRFNVPEVLSGSISYVKEEFEDVPAEVIEVESDNYVKLDDLLAEVEAIETMEQFNEFVSNMSTKAKVLLEEEVKKLREAAKKKKESLGNEEKPEDVEEEEEVVRDNRPTPNSEQSTIEDTVEEDDKKTDDE